ncbi:MAG: hypothetical protein ACI8XZ_005676 [Gammaproteobacteria bacterium]|jgi:hypothetical protein
MHLALRQSRRQKQRHKQRCNAARELGPDLDFHNTNYAVGETQEVFGTHLDDGG